MQRSARALGLPSAPVLASLLLALLLAHALAPVAVGAQLVRLELRPYPGDTLELGLHQQVEMSGTFTVGGADSTRRMTTTLEVHTRSIVQQVTGTGATLVAITDSVRVGGGDPARGETLRQALEGKRMLLHMSPDGTTRVLDGGGMMSPEASTLLAQMPATLPTQAVRVGTRWTQRVRMPLPGDVEGAPRGTLDAVFRLDSLSANGDLAWLSMRGTLSRKPEGGKRNGGATLASTGKVTGMMRVDRRRGFLTEASATIDVQSTVTPAAGAPGPPMRFRTRIVQRLWSVDKP